MKHNNDTEQSQSIFSLIEAMRKKLNFEKVTIDSDNLFLDSIENHACEMANEIAALKASENHFHINLKEGKKSANFCRPYYFHGVHSGNIHYMVEHFCESSFNRVGDVIDGMDNFIASRFIDEKTPSRSTYGCLRLNTPDHRTIVNSAFVVAISESKIERGATAVIHLSSGMQVDTDISYEQAVSAYLDYLGKERGTVKRPAGI